MSDIQQIIEATERLCNTLSEMANNELKFGWDLGLRLENLSYDMLKASNELREIKSYLIGGVA